jgi:hypothetical protein
MSPPRLELHVEDMNIVGGVKLAPNNGQKMVMMAWINPDTGEPFSDLYRNKFYFNEWVPNHGNYHWTTTVPFSKHALVYKFGHTDTTQNSTASMSYHLRIPTSDVNKTVRLPYEELGDDDYTVTVPAMNLMVQDTRPKDIKHKGNSYLIGFNVVYFLVAAAVIIRNAIHHREQMKSSSSSRSSSSRSSRSSTRTKKSFL